MHYFKITARLFLFCFVSCATFSLPSSDENLKSLVFKYVVTWEPMALVCLCACVFFYIHMRVSVSPVIVTDDCSTQVQKTSFVVGVISYGMKDRFLTYRCSCRYRYCQEELRHVLCGMLTCPAKILLFSPNVMMSTSPFRVVVSHVLRSILHVL